MKVKKVDMLSGSVTKGMITLTLPIMIMNVGQTLFNIIDMTVLKMFSDDDAVGAVGAPGTLITLCTALLIGISVGANVVVAKRIGEGNKEGTERAVKTALSMSVLGGFLLMLVGVLFAEAFLKTINCPGELMKEAALYFRLNFIGIPFLMLYNFCAAILRAAGDTKRPMYFLLLGGIIKIVFTILFASVFDLRAAGVGAATIISNIVIGLLALCALNGVKDIYIDLKKIRFYGTELKEMLFVGIPSGMQSAMYSLANTVIAAAVNSFGANAATGIAIANQFDGLIYQIVYAPSLAVVPYVSQNVGAGNIPRVSRAVSRAVLITIALGAVFGSFFAVFSGQLSAIMSDTPEVIQFSRQKMIIVSSTYFLCGINEIIGGALKGLGKPVISAAATFVYMCLLRFIWVYMIFPLHPNLTFLYLVWPIGWILSVLTLLMFYFPSIAKLSQSQRAN